MPKRQRIVILGAGFAGLRLALRLSKVKDQSEIILIDKNETHIYTPWLYELATGFLSDGKTKQILELKDSPQTGLKKIIQWSEAKSISFRQATVTGVDFETRHVLLAGGQTLSFDQLVIALGSETSYYGIKGLKNFSLPLKSVSEAMAVRQELEELLDLVRSGKKENAKIVIGGAGATGVELSSELANYIKFCVKKKCLPVDRARVILVEAGATVLSGLSNTLQSWALSRLQKLGVDVMLNAAVSEVDRHKINFTGQVEPITYDLMIWTGGITQNQTVQSLALPKDAKFRIKVLPTLQVEGHPNIFALGDAAALINPKTGKVISATAQMALREADIAAHNIFNSWYGLNQIDFPWPKHPVSLIPIGDKHCLADLYGLPARGYLIHWLQKLVDLRYYLSILPLAKALKFWRKAENLYSLND